MDTNLYPMSLCQFMLLQQSTVDWVVYQPQEFICCSSGSLEDQERDANIGGVLVRIQAADGCLLESSPDGKRLINLSGVPFMRMLIWPLGFPSDSVVKNMPANAGDMGEFDPWVGKSPWKRKWRPTPVFLPGKSYEQGSLAGCSPWGSQKSCTWLTN